LYADWRAFAADALTHVHNIDYRSLGLRTDAPAKAYAQTLTQSAYSSPFTIIGAAPLA
jgi:hypothetical protein